MGQTLTNGVYLPDEGERNCYAGLAANWNILDGAVGTVADHTTALSGKAPLVHTHTKSDITDFPAYGNAAGTICEGNDSRLSDARTPVAHTHTKSDVTDLLNSDFVPSANNSYDLGSSSYQWNNLYAKNYFYNGTQWGLDKSNTWTQINDFKTLRVYGVTSNNLVAYPPSGVKGDSSTFSLNVICSDKNLGNYAASGVANIGMGQSGGTSYVALNASTIGSTDQNAHSIQIGLQIAASDNANIGSFYPTQNGGINLGTSTNKWKTLNGINPGALSLPRGGTTENVDYYNVATAIKPSGGTATDFSGAINYYQPAIDGWLSLVVTNCTELAVWEAVVKYGTVVSGSTRNRQIMIPVLANHTYEITIQGTAWFAARLIPCQGNV